MSAHLQGTAVAADVQTYPPDTIAALASLLAALAKEGVRYCLWKSNIRLPEALAGQTDLDVLVEREQAPLFRQILDRHGLKPLVARKGAAYPGIEHFLGMEQASGRLFHLHVHYQLVLGERFVKSFRIPLEREMLRSTRLLQGVPVPRPALELSILSVRALLKYRARDALKDILGIRTMGIPLVIQSEVAWLLNQTSVEEVRDLLRSSGRPIPMETVTRFLEVLPLAPRSGFTWLQLRQNVRVALRRWRRTGPIRANIASWGAAWRRNRVLGRRLPNPRMTPLAGGMTVALLGADGSGKSTAAQALSEWLGWKLDVRSYYMGSNAPSWASQTLTLVFRALRRAHRGLSRGGTLGPRAARPVAWMRDTALALRELSIARDRTKRHRAGQRAAQAGNIVVFDRFPLEVLSTNDRHRMLDGPRICRTFGRELGPLRRGLARTEQRMYRGFGVPDYLIVLDVRPEIAVARKPDHAFDILDRKAHAAREVAALAERSGERVHVIRVNASMPLEEMILELKRKVWNVL